TSWPERCWTRSGSRMLSSPGGGVSSARPGKTRASSARLGKTRASPARTGKGGEALVEGGTLVTRVRAVQGRRGVVVIRLDQTLALQQCPYLGLPEPAVPARGPDAADPAGRRPSGDGLRVDAEHRGHLAWRQQTISRVHETLLQRSDLCVCQ